ncbi:MAG: septum formation protein Maf [Anaerolineales bacterium]|nr:septum formation protein Maf [Anaerolineales bacterium]
MRPVVLASSSPRRQELLALGGVRFEVRATATPESVQAGETARAMVARLSRAKARAAASSAPADALVLGADTTVVLSDGPQETILEKPRDAADAARMLRLLRGRAHAVLTAITLLDTATGTATTEVVAAQVPMRAYTDAEIDAYVASGDPLDKAGAYAIQYAGFQPVDLTQFSDCFATVMGLPVCRVVERLRARGAATDPALRPANCDAPRACPIVAHLGGGAPPVRRDPTNP